MTQHDVDALWRVVTQSIARGDLTGAGLAARMLAKHLRQPGSPLPSLELNVQPPHEPTARAIVLAVADLVALGGDEDRIRRWGRR